MLTLNIIFLAAFSQLLRITLASPFEPSLEHRQLGSCATAPCAAGLCCSQFKYCGTGPDYCQAGSCVGGVGGTCAAGACCSAFGYCQTNPSLCPAPPISTPTPTSTPTPSVSPTSVPPPVNTGLVNQWNQCAGQGWLGGTVCVAPYKCVALSIWYS